ncbi:MAG: hypothetical protein K0S25_825 [Bacillus sp. (in: firmicutes)]|jgi:hypothetical protein|nr:hypothetical protein [Sphingobacterium sp.]MDF2535435.1 hypothetical protein [Bacillales bacterium]MDF2903187.1 hypothetical protein [Bacillus sp. (in: firmicutes)]
MNRDDVLQLLNSANLHYWCADFAGCIDIIKKLKQVKVGVNSNPIVKKCVKDLISHELMFKKMYLKINKDTNNYINGDKIRSIVSRNDKDFKFIYSFKIVADNFNTWIPENANNSEDGIVEIDEHSKIDALFEIDNSLYRGKMLFSSLGVGMGRLINKKEACSINEQSSNQVLNNHDEIHRVSNFIESVAAKVFVV